MANETKKADSSTKPANKPQQSIPNGKDADSANLSSTVSSEFNDLVETAARALGMNKSTFVRFACRYTLRTLKQSNGQYQASADMLLDMAVAASSTHVHANL